MNSTSWNENIKTKDEIVREYESEIRELTHKMHVCTDEIMLQKHNRKCYKIRIQQLEEAKKLYQ